MKKTISIACAVAAPILFSQSAFASFDYFKSSDDGFKRYSISGGWLHADPQGKATPIENKTAIKDGNKYKVAGTPTEFQGLGEWSSPGTGLESDTVDTFGMLLTYYADEHWAMEVKAGIPPKVDILGKGEVYANLTKPIPSSLQVTDMTRGGGVASTARAWLPAALVQYQFGKRGVDKFRPYVGAGVMYAYFNDIKLNPGIGQDLQVAAGRLQLIQDGKALEALGSKNDVRDNKDAGVADMRVKVEADSAWAPIINLGATYDFDENWYAVGSISYAKLDSDTIITVNNGKGEKLIEAKSNIDIDPYITYLGVGYRF
ncbi:OmpW family outer membrane protein [Psychrobacter sp.]|uniref:OmpW/AlkL family protein n=1 Tax=Psychrobacter sp. TaxID=56811 RepID=UPI0025DC79B8|nr:OmpW family outer membrane protein [Psychrobacter sp.]